MCVCFEPFECLSHSSLILNFPANEFMFVVSVVDVVALVAVFRGRECGWSWVKECCPLLIESS